MSEYLQAREKALTEQVEQLARIRRCSKLDAWTAMQATVVENLRDSRETAMEDTWRIDLEIVDRRLASEQGFSSVGARETYR